MKLRSTITVSLLLLASGVACSGATPYTVTTADAPVDPELQAEQRKREQKLAQLDKIPPDLREACALKEGECVMYVREARNELIRGRQTYSCQEKPREEQPQCEIDRMIADGEYVGEIRDFYEYDNWCIDQIIACTNDEEVLVAAQQKQAMIKARRQTFDGAPHNLEAQRRITVIEAQVKYIRSALPQKAENICKDTGANCNERLEKAQIAYEKAVVLEEEQFDQDATMALHKAISDTEIDCYEPELKCLLSSVTKYGETGETKAKLESNLKLIEERELLGAKHSPSTKEKCELLGIQKHQDAIVKTYGRSERSPGPYFRFQLHKEFERMFQAQINCLESAIQ